MVRRGRVTQGGIDIKAQGNCHLCGATATEQMYCKGCRHMVCFRCDETGIWEGKHGVTAHRFTEAERHVACPACKEPMDRTKRRCLHCKAEY